MLESTSTHQSTNLSRRTLVAGAAWTIPVIAAAAAAPIAAASQCVPSAPLSTLTATYVRTSTNAAYYQWSNVFRAGDRIRLNVAASVTVNAGGASLPTADNLTRAIAPAGSTFGSVPAASEALRLSFNVGANFSTARFDFSFAYAANGTSYTPFTGTTGTTFTVTDIDGTYSAVNSGGLGAERVHFVSGATGTITNSAYLTGAGTAASPWVRRAGSVPDLTNLDTYSTSAGNVTASASASSWSLAFAAAAPSGTPSTNYNIWVTPFQFTATNPTPC